jgi:hypothetical protein
LYSTPEPLAHKAGDGNRTHISSLEGWCSTTELHLHRTVCPPESEDFRYELPDYNLKTVCVSMKKTNIFGIFFSGYFWPPCICKAAVNIVLEKKLRYYYMGKIFVQAAEK